MRNKRILIVDDDATVRAPVVKYFRGLGHDVDGAAEAEEAGALVAVRRYDAAIIDLRLTNLNGAEGIELVREIRGHDAATVVVVLSAYVSPEARAEATRLGASVLQKPHPLADLARLALGGELVPGAGGVSA